MMHVAVLVCRPFGGEHVGEIGTREPIRTRYEVDGPRTDHGRKREPGEDTPGCVGTMKDDVGKTGFDLIVTGRSSFGCETCCTSWPARKPVEVAGSSDVVVLA